MRKLITVLLSAFFLISSALSYAESTNEKMNVIARKNIDDLTIRVCTDEITNKDFEIQKLLLEYTTVSEMCSCVQRETSFAVTDDLANKIISAQIDYQANSVGKNISKDNADTAFQNFQKLYTLSKRACIEKFIRAKNR
jgi:hypothetical protein